MRPQIQSARYLLCVGILLAVASASHAQATDPPIDFAHTIVPILKTHCVECHGGHRKEGEFSINTRELVVDSGLVEPGDSSVSYLIDLVTTDDADLRMPKDRAPLSSAEVAALRAWVDAGLPWEDGFSFAPDDYEPPLLPRRPELPPAAGDRTNPVDRILDAYLAERQLPQPKPIDDATFMRRAYLDVVGLLPPRDELRAFRADADPRKRDRLIDRLLSSHREYAEHWLTFWNDLLRNSYSGTGYIDGGRKPISAWLYRALLENKAYDEFVRELVSPSPESEGFIRGIKWRGNVNASQQPEIQFAQNVSQVFLGINMKCASCHDSFIDRWTLEETYALAAITADEPLEAYRCDKPTGKTVAPAWMFPEIGQVDASADRDERLRQLSELMTHTDNGRLTRTIVNRLWHRLMGRGIVHPVDAMQTRPWSADLLDWLAVYLADSDYDLKAVIRVILSSQAYQSQTIVLDDEPSAPEFVYTGPIAKRMTAEQFMDALWLLTDTAPREPHPKAAGFLDSAPAESTRTYRASLVDSDLLMRSLGRPNREQVVSDRPTVLSTLQALDLSNSPILAETLHRGAENILKRFTRDGGEVDSNELIDWLFESALSREPTSTERRVALEVLAAPPTAQGIEDLTWLIIMLPEFQYVR